MQQRDIIPEKLLGLDLNEGLNRVAGNTELYKNLLFSFYLDNRDKTQKIQQALLANDIDTARHSAHSVKGISGNISARQLFAAASDLEHQLNQESLQNLPEVLDQFIVAMEEVLNSLAFLAGTHNSEAPSTPEDSPVNWDSVAQNIQELAVLLDGFDMDAEPCFHRLQNQLSQQRNQQVMHKLDNALSNLEFDLASEILFGLAETLNIKLH